MTKNLNQGGPAFTVTAMQHEEHWIFLYTVKEEIFVGNLISQLSYTVIAEIFERDLISYFRLKVRNLVAYENHARITVYATPSSLYENL